MPQRKKAWRRKAAAKHTGGEGAEGASPAPQQQEQEGQAEGQQQQQRQHDDGRDRWKKPLVLESALFEEYYRANGCVPPAEWDAFMAALRRPLPTTLRVNSAGHLAPAMLARLRDMAARSEHLPTVEGEALSPPRPVGWYPGGMAWQFDIGRKTLRDVAELKQLHAFVVAQNEEGNITRQEAVSMVPPLLLDVGSAHRVLDMCAAPGSKTTQLLEMLHAGLEPGRVPAGFVVANDVDIDRCYTLVHQSKRIGSPCFLVTCHPAEQYPLPRGKLDLTFDRILCDVPCSGDGTIRKNLDVWQKFSPMNSVFLHKIQTRIAKRGAQLLRVGGKMVYSTCSMNPIEDEAVVAELLRWSQGALQLVDVSDKLPLLKRSQGVSTWRLYYGLGKWADTLEELPVSQARRTQPSCFPPTPEEAASFHLERCVRLLPHQNDTGGFFVAVLTKVAELPKGVAKFARDRTSEAPEAAAAAPSASPAESPSLDKQQGEEAEPAASPEEQETLEGVPDEALPQTPQNRRHSRHPHKDDTDPMVPASANPRFESVVANIKDFYGVDDEFQFTNLVTRTKDLVRLLFVSKEIFEIIEANNSIKALNLVQAGLKLFEEQSHKDDIACHHRLSTESLGCMVPHMHKRVVNISWADLLAFLIENDPSIAKLSCAAEIESFSNGCYTVVVAEGELKGLPLSAWRGRFTTHLLVPKKEIESLRNLYAPQAAGKLQKEGGTRQQPQPMDTEAAPQGAAAPAAVAPAAPAAAATTESPAAGAGGEMKADINDGDATTGGALKRRHSDTLPADPEMQEPAAKH
eukprot:m51a1_g14368 putative trna (cytosine -c )-methyltransferase (800) ;mRNA; r:247386-250172